MIRRGLRFYEDEASSSMTVPFDADCDGITCEGTLTAYETSVGGMAVHEVEIHWTVPPPEERRKTLEEEVKEAFNGSRRRFTPVSGRGEL